MSDKESINGELYRVQDETTLILWCDILRFTFESDFVRQFFPYNTHFKGCLLYTSDAADEEDSVDLGGRRIIKKKKRHQKTEKEKKRKRNDITQKQ